LVKLDGLISKNESNYLGNTIQVVSTEVYKGGDQSIEDKLENIKENIYKFDTNQNFYKSKQEQIYLWGESKNKYILEEFLTEDVLEQPTTINLVNQMITDIIQIKNLSQTESIVYENLKNIYKNTPETIYNLIISSLKNAKIAVRGETNVA
jgi:hypothetical protein